MARTTPSLVAAVLALSVGVPAVAPGAEDVPTWQVGDWWDVVRTFDLDVTTTDPFEMAVTLATQEAYRLTVVEISDRATTAMAGPLRAYRRARSGGTVSGTGTVNIGGIPLELRWKPGATSEGEDWVAVGDLAQLGESFSLNASLQAHVLAWLDLADVTLQADIEMSPRLEMLDFPLQTAGEQWQTTVSQHVVGRIRVAWNPSFPLWPGGQVPDDLDKTFDRQVTTGFVYRYVGREPRGSFAETLHVEVEPKGDLWYEPTIKEFAEKALGDLDFGAGYRLANVALRVIDWQVAADPPIEITGFVPERPRWGEWVELVGTTTPDSPVAATILENCSTASTVADTSGRFHLSLLCPDHDDHTPASDDAGSFGVEIEVQGVGRKVATIQLDPPLTGCRASWRLYR